MHANALMFISNLAKQILIRGYLLLEFLDFRQKQTFLLNKCFLLEMAYELLSQSRKLTKTGGEGGGGGLIAGGAGDWKIFWKKNKQWGRLFMREVIMRFVIWETPFAKDYFCFKFNTLWLSPFTHFYQNICMKWSIVNFSVLNHRSLSGKL